MRSKRIDDFKVNDKVIAHISGGKAIHTKIDTIIKEGRRTKFICPDENNELQNFFFDEIFKIKEGK